MKHENWKATGVLLTDILEKLKGIQLTKYVKNVFDTSWILSSFLTEAYFIHKEA